MARGSWTTPAASAPVTVRKTAAGRRSSSHRTSSSRWPRSTTYPALRSDRKALKKEIGKARTTSEIIAQDEGKFRLRIHGRDYASDGFRCFEFRRSLVQSPCSLDPFIIAATVPLTADRCADEAAACRMIEVQVIANHRMYWSGHVFTDEQYAETMARKAERRRVRELDRIITGRLIRALIADGYVIKANVMEAWPKYKRSRSAEKVVEHLLDYEMAEVIAIKGQDEAWLRLVFGESGWDVIQDYSENIEGIVDSVIDPHLPWNKTTSYRGDPGYEVFVLPLPDDYSCSPKDMDASLYRLMAGLSKSLGD